MKTLEARMKARRLRNDILFGLGALALTVALVWAVVVGLRGNNEYNHHMCVDVYGLNEDCQ